MFSSISDLTWRKVGSDEQQTASHHLGWTAPPRRYFSLIIQTSVTPFLVFIPVSLIFFLFINFFHFPNIRDVVSHIKNPWLRHTFSYWLLPPPQWQRHHAEFLSWLHWQLIDNWLAGTVFSLINYCCFVYFIQNYSSRPLVCDVLQCTASYSHRDKNLLFRSVQTVLECLV